MTALDAHQPERQRTRRLIEAIAAGELGAKLRAQVASRHPGATIEEVEEAFQEACLIAQRSCRGVTEAEVFVWLRTTTRRELGQMRWRARRRAQLEAIATASPTTDQSDSSLGAAADAWVIEAEDQ